MREIRREGKGQRSLCLPQPPSQEGNHRLHNLPLIAHVQRQVGPGRDLGAGVVDRAAADTAKGQGLALARGDGVGAGGAAQLLDGGIGQIGAHGGAGGVRAALDAGRQLAGALENLTRPGAGTSA